MIWHRGLVRPSVHPSVRRPIHLHPDPQLAARRPLVFAWPDRRTATGRNLIGFGL